MNFARRMFCLSLFGFLLLGVRLSVALDEIGPGRPDDIANAEEERTKRIQRLAEKYVSDLRLQGVTEAQNARILSLAVSKHKELAIQNELAKLSPDQELVAMKAFAKLEQQIKNSKQDSGANGKLPEVDLPQALKDAEEAVVLTVKQKKAIEEISRLHLELWDSIWNELTDEQQARHIKLDEMRRPERGRAKKGGRSGG